VEAGDATDRHFDDFYSAINSELRSLDLKLSRVKYPHDKQVYMGVVNTVRTGVVGFSPSARRRRKPHDTVRGDARTWPEGNCGHERLLLSLLRARRRSGVRNLMGG